MSKNAKHVVSNMSPMSDNIKGIIYAPEAKIAIPACINGHTAIMVKQNAMMTPKTLMNIG